MSRCHLCSATDCLRAGLEGVDAFERLKQEAAKASISSPPISSPRLVVW
jgi:hypothetical protein